MKINSILCDNCKEELVVDSPYPHKYILEITSPDVGLNTSGAEYAVFMSPQTTRPLHFCNWKCLRLHLLD